VARPFFSTFTTLPPASPPPPEPEPGAVATEEPPTATAAAVAPAPPTPPPVVAFSRPAPRPAAPAEVVMPAPAAVAAAPEEEIATPNVFVSALRRWPWLVVGLVGGVALGLLIHMQRAPVYQSGAQLLVIKNRSEVSGPGGGPDTRMMYVEDYVATQVTLLTSEQMLRLAAAKMYERNNRDPFVVPLPGTPANPEPLVAFVGARFGVDRVREKGGNNAMSNVVALTMKSPHPADAPKYLDAIIEAYQGYLRTVYEEASISKLLAIDAALTQLRNKLSDLKAEKGRKERDRDAISQEQLDGIRGRITANRNQLGQKELQLKEAEYGLGLIQTVDKAPRSARLVVMEKLGVKPDRSNVGGTEARNPQDVLFLLELERAEAATRLGPQHPQMVNLDGKIAALRKRIAEEAGVGREGDELNRHQFKLETEVIFLNKTIKDLTRSLDKDETDASRMTVIQREVTRAETEQIKTETEIKDKEQEKTQVENTKNAGGYTVRAITPPGSGVQVAPVMWQSLLIGGILGMFAGGGLAVGTELSDRSFRSPAEIRRRLGVPVLGHVPRIQTDAPPTRSSVTGLDPTLVGFLRPMSSEAEAYRGVRTQLYFSTQGRGHQVIQVTSPTPGDGKSTLAANLAVSVAQSGKRVVLLDCDFRKPRVHRLFNIQHPEVGLASVVAGEAKLEAAVRATEVENLSVMPCGPRPANPAELLTSPKFQEVLAELKGMFDFVIVDTPPVLAVTDPSAVAPRVDGVLLVFRMTKTARPTAERAREQLGAVGARVLGVIVNAASARSAGYAGYGYAYQYDYVYADDYAHTDDDSPAVTGGKPPKKG
jgi:capsular exopolysaccharide synthesis family protein